jgi:catechol 2,3-dioxygenase
LADFAALIARLAAAQYPQYPTDHLMHLADYADDPDGNGLEVAFETLPRVGRPNNGPGGYGFLDSDGRQHNGREAIDIDWLFSVVQPDQLGETMPDGTMVGHMHLRVADYQASHDWYRDVIGFESNMFNPGMGMYDMTARGSFPHRMAGNTWESAGRPQRAAGLAGMRHYTLELRTAAERDAIVGRQESAGGGVERIGSDVILNDPSGTRLLLSVPA